VLRYAMRIMNVSIPAEETLAKNQGQYRVSPLSTTLVMTDHVSKKDPRCGDSADERVGIAHDHSSWKGDPSEGEETILSPGKSVLMCSGLKTRSARCVGASLDVKSVLDVP
jgi:hypothetical protein